LGRPSQYSNHYQRFLFGLEAAPAPWLNVTALAGPDVRDWPRVTESRFRQDEVLWWLDASVTLRPTAADTVLLRLTRFEQPAFTSQSMYEDIRYDLTWRHKFTDRLTVGAGCTLYIGDWQGPVNREDWITTPSAMVAYAFSAHLNGELAWSYDLADSRVPVGPLAPYADGREFTRNLISVSLKYLF